MLNSRQTKFDRQIQSTLEKQAYSAAWITLLCQLIKKLAIDLVFQTR